VGRRKILPSIGELYFQPHARLDLEAWFGRQVTSKRELCQLRADCFRLENGRILRWARLLRSVKVVSNLAKVLTGLSFWSGDIPGLTRRVLVENGGILGQ